MGRPVNKVGWILLLIFAAGMRFYRLESAALWYDEGFSVVMSTHSGPGIWSIAASDLHPPLYYLILKGWVGVFGSGLFALRALSVCAGLITVVLVVWLTALVANQRAAFLAGISLAMLPLAVRYSQEVRMYALLGFWLTGAMIALVFWVKTPRRHAYLAAYALFIVAGLYTHYFAILGVIAHWLYLLTLPRSANDQRLRLVLQPGWWTANGVAALLFVPWLPTLAEQLANSGTLSWMPPATVRSIPSFLWQYLTLDNGTGLPPVVYWGLILSTLAMCVYCLISDRHPAHLSRLLVIYFWAPLLLIFAVSWRFPLMSPRYFVFSALALPMLLGIAVDRAGRSLRRAGVVIFILVLAIEAIGIRNRYEQQQTVDGRSRLPLVRMDLIADAFNRHCAPGDQIIVLNEFWYPSLLYYNTTAARPKLYAPDIADDQARSEVSRRFRVLYHAEQNDAFVARLADVPLLVTRVWLVDGVTDADTGREIPCQWRLLDTFVTGDNRLRLYRTDAVRDSRGQTSCPAP
jgi:mannosyltransferase